MNRWLKYGGIMPELFNTSTLTPTEGYYLNDEGQITSSVNFHYYLIRMSPGKYKFKFFSNALVTASRIRVIQYNLNNEFISLLASYAIPARDNGNHIYTLTAEFDTESIIGLTCHRNATIMEIEKL